MPTVSMRELSRNASGVVEEVVRSGRPALVTRHGRPVAALVSINEEDLEDWILANAPEFVQEMRQADEEAARGDTVPWERVQEELAADGFYGGGPAGSRQGGSG
jgi:prevent-host-death family protein